MLNVNDIILYYINKMYRFKLYLSLLTWLATIITCQEIDHSYWCAKTCVYLILTWPTLYILENSNYKLLLLLFNF